MNKKIFLTISILLAILFPAAQFLSAQVAAPPTGPLVTGISPSSGEQGQTLGLIISGQNFQTGALVSFSPAEGISLNSTNFVTATEIKINITIANDAPILIRDVIVTNPNQITGTFKQGFAINNTTPPPLLGLTATDALDGKIDLAWVESDVGDFAYYAIYWNEIEFTNLTGVSPNWTISDQTTVAFQVRDLTNGTKYYFAVNSVDRNGNENKSVLPVSATPTPSSVPSVTVPFPTAPATNSAPTSATQITTDKKAGESLSADLTAAIIVLILAALGGLIYSILKKRPKKISKERELEKEIEKEEELRFLNNDSKLIKLDIAVGDGKIVDLVQKINNFSEEYKTTGILANLALPIFDAKKEALQKTLGGQVPAVGSDTLEYSIIIKPVSGVDIEWELAEVSLGGIQSGGGYKIKKRGDDFTYEKNVKVKKSDESWKKYADDARPEFADLKKIIKFHLDDLERQAE
ncbi:MAG: fibronectin type III domain-containing protein, partial [Patescibacteria group bacterium]